MENTKVFGSRLRSEIKKQGYKTYKEAADALGVSLSYFNQLMRDEREPSVELLNLICETLKITPNHLLGAVDSSSISARNEPRTDRASLILEIQSLLNSLDSSQLETIKLSAQNLLSLNAKNRKQVKD